MDQQQKIQIKSKQGEVVEFSNNLEIFSSYIKNVSDKSKPIILEVVSTKALNIMKSFLEAHQYNSKTMEYKIPIFSNNLKEHIDEISYNVLEQYIGIYNEFKENSKILLPVIELAHLINFGELKKIANIALQVPLFCGSNEIDIKVFKENFKFCEDNLNPQIQRKLFAENQQIFDKLRNEFKEKMKSLDIQKQQ